MTVRSSIVTALLTFALGATACSAGRYVRVEDLPPTKPADPQYRIAVGDVLSVRVFNQDAMSIERAAVRDDGKISLPFLQDVEVAGQSPSELGAQLQVKLKAFVVSPVVTVLVVERRPLRVSVVGEVARPGVYDLDRGAGVLAAVAVSGGLTAYAHKDRVFVLRNARGADGKPPPTRIRFRYDALMQGEQPAAAFRLEPGDVVTVE